MKNKAEFKKKLHRKNEQYTISRLTQERENWRLDKKKEDVEPRVDEEDRSVEEMLLLRTFVTFLPHFLF